MRLWDMPKPKFIDPNFRPSKVYTIEQILAENRSKLNAIMKPEQLGKVKQVGRFQLIEVVE